MLHNHFGIYGIILSPDQKKILLIIKSRGPYTGHYDLPGGSIEDSELLEDCLNREIKEETGCAVTNNRQLKTISSFFDYHTDKETCRLRHIGVIYYVEIIGEPKQDGDGEDSNGCIWCDINSLDLSRVTPFVTWAVNFLQNR
ncbi:MAG: NUDIX domain-containing protein [Rickettsiales bacterium]|nr:NUDIX domain-containing protein [Rickettsiales bacterium]